jgi:hypothetical protein
MLGGPFIRHASEDSIRIQEQIILPVVLERLPGGRIFRSAATQVCRGGATLPHSEEAGSRPFQRNRIRLFPLEGLQEHKARISESAAKTHPESKLPFGESFAEQVH